MAILTLYQPGTTIGHRDNPVQLGNFIDLRTEQVEILDGDSSVATLFTAAAASPHAILATGSDESVRNLKVDVAFLNRIAAAEDIGSRRFFRERLRFDISRYDNVDPSLPKEAQVPNVSVDGPLDWSGPAKTLAEVMTDVGVGTRMILRFDDPAGENGKRYFRILIHRARGGPAEGDASAFAGKQTALQFEELVKGRVMVPLGIGESDCVDGVEIVSTYDMPTERVTKGVPDIVWTLRHGGSTTSIDHELYGKSFPLARIIFKEQQGREELAEIIEEYKESGKEIPPALIAALRRTWRLYSTKHPKWVAGVETRCLSSRSYMNSTLRAVVSHSDRIDLFPPRDPSDPVQQREYRYHLFMLDGTSNTLRDWDPPVEVDDDQ